MAGKVDLPAQLKSLSPAVLSDLCDIEPSVSATGLHLFPCDFEFYDGTTCARVYIVDATEYIREWGVWPWQDCGKQWIPAELIRSACSSYERLTAKFANKVYAAGETGMGYCAYSVDVRDGRRFYFVSGNAVDFPCWPAGVTPADVVTVNPHDRDPEHRSRSLRSSEMSAHYHWSPFRPSNSK